VSALLLVAMHVMLLAQLADHALGAQAPLLRALAPLFVRPLPVWNYWWLLLVPLCAGISIVYKSIKCSSIRQVPWEASVITVWMIASMVAAAAVLYGIVHLVGH